MYARNYNSYTNQGQCESVVVQPGSRDSPAFPTPVNAQPSFNTQCFNPNAPTNDIIRGINHSVSLQNSNVDVNTTIPGMDIPVRTTRNPDREFQMLNLRFTADDQANCENAESEFGDYVRKRTRRYYVRRFKAII